MMRVLLAAGIVFFLAAGPASADISYTFSGVTFDDGGTLTGTFVTNDTRTSLLNYDITTSPGTNIGFEYTPTTAPVDFSALPFIIVVETPGLEHLLEVTFTGGLTATGAPITIGTFDSFEQGTGGARRVITAGEAIVAAAVPEPSTITLLGIGMLGLLTYLRLRRET